MVLFQIFSSIFVRLLILFAILLKMIFSNLSCVICNIISDKSLKNGKGSEYSSQFSVVHSRISGKTISEKKEIISF